MVVPNVAHTQESLKFGNNADVRAPVQTQWISGGETLAGCYLLKAPQMNLLPQGLFTLPDHWVLVDEALVNAF